MRLVYTLFFLMLFFLPALVLTQPITLKGKVTIGDRKTAPGIEVRVKGSDFRTITDMAGTFIFGVSKIPATLLFTEVGYAVVEYKVTEENRSNVIAIRLFPTADVLEEVVVTGYSLAEVYHKAAPAVAIRGMATLSGKSAAISVTSSSLYRKRKAGPTVEAGMSSLREPPFKAAGAGSGLLTAGEVSDFKKWQLWANYTEAEFRTWSQHWGVALKERYCVQVQNHEHKALVGEKVYLVNAISKDTVWQAFTDNTGKAELWSNPDDNQNDMGTYSIVCNSQVVQSAVPFSNGINRIRLNKTCYVSNMVDIAFVVDATGSMGDEIHYLQEELQDIIAKTANKYVNILLRTGAVFYRDHADEYLTRYNDFTYKPANLVSFIKKQSAAGGGDMPEAVDDALATALDSLHWNEAAHSKILFLVLDAPPHDAAKRRMRRWMQKAAKNGVRIVPVVCSGIDKSTEYLMRCIALATNGSYVFLTDDSGIGNPHIKPTTDEFTVELLNNLLQRLIGEMVFVPVCDSDKRTEPFSNTIETQVKILLYPNPARGNITIEYSDEISEIFITDFTGKVLFKVGSSGKKGKSQASLANYPSGTYLAKYFIKSKGWGAEKFVVMH